jgi:hypothetical protein
LSKGYIFGYLRPDDVPMIVDPVDEALTAEYLKEYIT